MPNPSETLTLADLENWNRRDAAGNFLPSLAVLGHPVAHSVSPQMHNAALAMLAEKYPQLKEWKYFKFEIKPEELERALSLLSGKNFKGTNVTVPHKQAVAVQLSQLYEEALAKMTKGDFDAIRQLANTSRLFELPAESSANTVVFDRYPRAYSTDGYGLVQGLKRDLQVLLRGKTVVMLGTGGAASEAAKECVMQGCAVLWIGGRDAEKRRQLREQVHNRRVRHPMNTPKEAKIFDFDLADTTVAKDWPEDVVVINATTLGMKREDPLPLEVSLLGKRASVFDMVYNRQGPTKLVEAARARDLRAADGLGMLIWQGAKSLTMWLKVHEGLDISPESIAQTMMDAACATLGLPHRHA